jgi:hypothetical protein
MPGARIGDWGGFGQVGQQLVLVPPGERPLPTFTERPLLHLA